MPVIRAFKSLSQEDYYKFKASLGYLVSELSSSERLTKWSPIHFLKKKKKKK